MVYEIKSKHVSPQKGVSEKENVSATNQDLKKRCSESNENIHPSKKILTERHVLKSQKTPVLPFSPAKLNSPRTPPKGSGSPLKPPTSQKKYDATIPIDFNELNGTVVISAKDIAALDQEPAEEIDPNYDEFAPTIRIGDFSFEDKSTISAIDENLTDFPMELVKFKKLKTLNLSANLIPNIPDEIKNIQSLQSFDISSNTLTSLNPKLFDCTQLQSLNISENHITDLPDQIGNLKTLSQLEIDHNPIHTLPDSITQLKHLQFLDCKTTLIKWNNLSETVQNWIKRNAIDRSKVDAYQDIFAPEPQIDITGIDIPSDAEFVEAKLAKLKDPEYCTLSALNIVTLPDSLGEANNLKILNLSDNPFLKQLPETMVHLTELDFLNLKGTAIQFESLSRPLQDWLFDLRDNGCTIVGIDVVDLNDI